MVSEHPSRCRTTPARLEIYSHPRSRTSTYRRVRFGDIESALSPLLVVLCSPRGYPRAALRSLLLLSSLFLLHRYLLGSIIRFASLGAYAHPPLSWCNGSSVSTQWLGVFILSFTNHLYFSRCNDKNYEEAVALKRKTDKLFDFTFLTSIFLTYVSTRSVQVDPQQDHSVISVSSANLFSWAPADDIILP